MDHPAASRATWKTAGMPHSMAGNASGCLPYLSVSHRAAVAAAQAATLVSGPAWSSWRVSRKVINCAGSKLVGITLDCVRSSIRPQVTMGTKTDVISADGKQLRTRQLQVRSKHGQQGSGEVPQKASPVRTVTSEDMLTDALMQNTPTNARKPCHRNNFTSRMLL